MHLLLSIVSPADAAFVGDLLAAISSHAWGVATGLSLLALVYFARLPALAAQLKRLPASCLPYLPIALGLISGVAEALVTQRSWVAALVTGALAAIPSVAVALPSPLGSTDATKPS